MSIVQSVATSARHIQAVLFLLALVACRSPRRDGDNASKPRRSDPTPKAPANDAPPASSTPSAPATSRGAGADTVYDRTLDVTWLADANLPASLPLGVKGINPSGSMDYKTAVKWIAALNAYGNGAGYLGRNDWALPSTPASDPACSSRNRYSFGFGCTKSMFATVYLKTLSLTSPRSAVPIPAMTTAIKGFTHFQPYLYWSASLNANHSDTNENGFTTFSFNNGFQGSNVSRNHMYVVPMLKGRVPARGEGDKLVYDPTADVTWLADANLAATEAFGVKEIATSGAMSHTTALAWVAAMNRADGGRGYLGQRQWQLPPTVASDPTCSAKDTFGFGCKGSPLGSLYYNVLGLKKGTPVVRAGDGVVGPFRNLEPYLYWSCHAAPNGLACNADPDLPSHVFAWSFSFGNGFQGTTMYSNELYVTAYHPGQHSK